MNRPERWAIAVEPEITSLHPNPISSHTDCLEILSQPHVLNIADQLFILSLDLEVSIHSVISPAEDCEVEDSLWGKKRMYARQPRYFYRMYILRETPFRTQQRKTNWRHKKRGTVPVVPVDCLSTNSSSLR